MLRKFHRKVVVSALLAALGAALLVSFCPYLCTQESVQIALHDCCSDNIETAPAEKGKTDVCCTHFSELIMNKTALESTHRLQQPVSLIGSIPTVSLMADNTSFAPLFSKGDPPFFRSGRELRLSKNVFIL